MKPLVIAKTLPQTERETLGQDGFPGLDKAEAEREVAQWFDAGVKEMPKAQAVAAELDVSEGYLSKLRSGQKPVPMRAARAFKGNTAATLAYVRALLDSIGYVAVPKRTAITRDEVENRITDIVRRSTQLFKMCRREAAEEIGCDEVEIDRALEIVK